MEQWQDIATLVASIAIILGAVGGTARWAVKGVVKTAIDDAVKPLREDIHAIDIRLARVEESIRHIAPRATQ